MRGQAPALCSILLLVAMTIIGGKVHAQPSQWNKTRGMLYGTLIGDALGGPIEFQGHEWVQATGNPPKLWKKGEKMTDAEVLAAAQRFYLRSYIPLKPVPESYGIWSSNAGPGTLTDDSRNKMVLMSMLRQKGKSKQNSLSAIDLADAYVAWGKTNTIRSHSGYDTLCPQWMTEISKSILWMKGVRTPERALPLDRFWNGLPTCWGQMTLPPLAGIYPGDTVNAYKMAYKLAFFDNGFARDMNAAVVAGLSKALQLNPQNQSDEALWTAVISAMIQTDPYKYNEVPWCMRGIHKWIALADTFVNRSQGCPQRLFEQLDSTFQYNEKWEAQVPIAVCFSVLKMCRYNPLAAMQLSIEWGWDTDTYPQLLGAFVGAIYGDAIFKDEWKNTVSTRLLLDYDEQVDEWTECLLKLQGFFASP